MAPVIALITDFGLDDPYVGQVKGALLTHAPGAVVVDLTHGVPPFAVPTAAFFLAASWRHFPRGTVFVAVVDPGVGSARRVLLAEAAGRMALAPDNGLLALLLARHPGEVHDVTPPSSPVAGSASRTFHGRDLFAPLAARLAKGEPAARLGSPLDPRDIVRPQWAESRIEDGGLEATVLHVDRFGNCVLNLPVEPWAARVLASGEVSLTARSACRVRPVAYYAELGPDEVGILAGSQGHLELACDRASAAARLGIAPGAVVRLEGIAADAAEDAP